MQYFARLAERFEAGAERDVETGRTAYNGGRSAFRGFKPRDESFRSGWQRHVYDDCCVGKSFDTTPAAKAGDNFELVMTL